jgi:hypothetical protein
MKTKLFLFFTFLSLAINAQVSQAERQALIDFYNATDGDNWTNNTNWDTDPNATSNVNTWFGVTTAIRDGLEHVYWVSLNNNNISGELDFSYFTNLTLLSLGETNINFLKIPAAVIGSNNRLQVKNMANLA